MPREDRVVTSLGSQATIAVETDGPLVTTFRIDQVLRLPATSDKNRRSEVLVDQPITTRVTLKKDSPCVEVETCFANVVRDHRLRALFPTHLTTDLSYADRPFDVIERPISRTELYVCDELFFSGTGAQVAPVRAVDQRVIGSGKPGPISLQMQDVYFKVVLGKNPKYRHWCTPVY